MIKSKDRSYYIGASDVSFVVGNWNTKTFEKWYGTKLDINEMNFTNDAMMAGTAYEHKILNSLNIANMQKDKQIIRGRLRVNLDGNTDKVIFEVKTYNIKNTFKVPKKYKEQVWVQMYVSGIYKAFIVAYALEEKDYCNYYRDIETNRLSMHPIAYDSEFINEQFMPKFQYISNCLDKGSFPNEQEYRRCFDVSSWKNPWL